MIATSIFQSSLISFRLLPILVVVPVSSLRRTPMTVRIVLTVSLAIILGLGLANNFQHVPNNYLLLFFTEFLIGASLAFSFHAASAAVQTMGQLIDMQMGFGAAAMFDPNTEQTTSPFGELLTMTLLVALVIFNIHHDLLLGFAKLLEILPPGSALIWHDNWIKILGVHFTLGFIVMSPVILLLWMVDMTLGFISRSLPQIQVYFVGLPVKIGIGLIAMSWFMNHAMEPFHRILTQALMSWENMFGV